MDGAKLFFADVGRDGGPILARAVGRIAAEHAGETYDAARKRLVFPVSCCVLVEFREIGAEYAAHVRHGGEMFAREGDHSPLNGARTATPITAVRVKPV